VVSATPSKGPAVSERPDNDPRDDTVQPNQSLAWGPSIAGAKSEDTIIAAPNRPEIISASPGFPSLPVRAAGLTLERPDVVVRWPHESPALCYA